MTTVNILVISDLHAGITQDSVSDTKLILRDQHNVFGDKLIDYIKGLDEKIDYLVCAGDIANQGCKDSFQAGWEYVNKMAQELSISDILCVPGNHDHQSRPPEDNKYGFSPKHELQFITPPFPFSCYHKNTHFWAWNWELTSTEKCNVLSINSSAYHGYGSEYKHGRVALEVTDQIKQKLTSSAVSRKPFNVLLTHHHPKKMDFVDLESDSQAMEGAEYLLRALENADLGPWLIIHGHKHYAQIGYANSQIQGSQLVLSAGSLSAVLYETIENRTSNQFYVLSIEPEKSEYLGKVVGKFKTYEANKLQEWQPSKSNNLPANGGFGSIYTPDQVVNDLKAQISKENPFLEGVELSQFKEKIEHFTPDEISRLNARLHSNKFSVVRCQDNHIIEVGLGNE
ncbi:metallophosphoesterase family protein [Vibrio splendidus]|uniref:metallophosphoesterase family protein n=1 Tax=Vibrio splendidus TaxID=29497 RepID=UPI00076A64EE|nr:metallophosphoesterase [Vibrio splendidus]PHX05156.1 3',5'-cyclic adenosine monophosphate phosphodiesterase CpdA [Vibrio splendidus]